MRGYALYFFFLVFLSVVTPFYLFAMGGFLPIVKLKAKIRNRWNLTDYIIDQRDDF